MKAKAVVAIGILLAMYLCGYFWLGTYKDAEREDEQGVRRKAVIRIYHHEWQTMIYIPMARVESRFRGIQVGVGTWSDFGF